MRILIGCILQCLSEGSRSMSVSRQRHWHSGYDACNSVHLQRIISLRLRYERLQSALEAICRTQIPAVLALPYGRPDLTGDVRLRAVGCRLGRLTSSGADTVVNSSPTKATGTLRLDDPRRQQCRFGPTRGPLLGVFPMFSLAAIEPHDQRSCHPCVHI